MTSQLLERMRVLFYLDRKWKDTLKVLVVVAMCLGVGIHVFVLSVPPPTEYPDLPAFPELQLPPPSDNYTSFSGEIDATAVVSSVIDGDTFDTSSEGRIRLADIDAPEYWESGYDDAKDFLVSLIDDKTVYLDIDDVYWTDKYGRLVCVVYVEYNSTHAENVNKVLLVEGHATIWDFHNEFAPATWNLYISKELIREYP
jgi:endonuclease YncB( thermonuclease family)